MGTFRGRNVGVLLAVPLVAAAGAPDLGRYVGKYPFDKIYGVTFFDHPMVQSAINRLVTEPAVRLAMRRVVGPSTPVFARGNMVVGEVCQQHNCPSLNWSVAVAESGSLAEVCFHDSESMGGRSRWYLAPGKSEMRGDECE